MKTSLTGVGAVIVTLLNLILPLLGFDVPMGTTESLALAILNIAGFISLIYGQWRRPETRGFIFKK